jgi:hypothetical protein
MHKIHNLFTNIDFFSSGGMKKRLACEILCLVSVEKAGVFSGVWTGESVADANGGIFFW